MAQAVLIFVSIVLSYLIGSIPTAYIFGRLLKGIDIREHGSGNVGATNAFRVLGKGPGTIVLILDILKGVIVTTLIVKISGIMDSWMPVLLGLIAVCGHNWTIFLNFKGGKGIATGLGVLIGLAIVIESMRPVLLIVLGTWLIVFCASGYVSLASIITAVILPIMMTVFNQDFILKIFGIVLCVFVVFRHKPNIKRLLEGKENRVKLPFQK